MKDKKIPNDFFITEGKVVEEILRKAVKNALLLHKKANNPVAIWKDGKVLILSPEDIKVSSQ